jgi:copper chaperone CopZ
MSLYIHHVPGRLRVWTQSLRCQPGKIEAAAGRLRESAGIDAVAVNIRAGSITVHYDPAQRTQAELLAMLEEIGCVGARRVAGQQDSQVAGLFGKALLGALAQTLAQGSVRTLVGALR